MQSSKNNVSTYALEYSMATESFSRHSVNTRQRRTELHPNISAERGTDRRNRNDAVLYKTELCNSFQMSGSCKYNDNCQFAHGEHELRQLDRHPRYKTVKCKSFHLKGFCPYGSRCHYIHKATPTMELNGTTKNHEQLALGFHVESLWRYRPRSRNISFELESATSGSEDGEFLGFQLFQWQSKDSDVACQSSNAVQSFESTTWGTSEAYLPPFLRGVEPSEQIFYMQSSSHRLPIFTKLTNSNN